MMYRTASYLLDISYVIDFIGYQDIGHGIPE